MLEIIRDRIGPAITVGDHLLLERRRRACSIGEAEGAAAKGDIFSRGIDSHLLDSDIRCGERCDMILYIRLDHAVADFPFGNAYDILRNEDTDEEIDRIEHYSQEGEARPWGDGDPAHAAREGALPFGNFYDRIEISVQAHAPIYIDLIAILTWRHTVALGDHYITFEHHQSFGLVRNRAGEIAQAAL